MDKPNSISQFCSFACMSNMSVWEEWCSVGSLHSELPLNSAHCSFNLSEFYYSSLIKQLDQLINYSDFLRVGFLYIDSLSRQLVVWCVLWYLTQHISQEVGVNAISRVHTWAHTIISTQLNYRSAVRVLLPSVRWSFLNLNRGGRSPDLNQNNSHHINRNVPKGV